MPKRPSPQHYGRLAASVVRGPREDGRWYWRIRAGQASVSTLWATTPEVTAELRALHVAGAARVGAVIDNLGDVVDYWYGWILDSEQHSDRTKANARTMAKHLVPGLAHVPPRAVRPQHLEVYRDLRLQSGASSTVAKELKTLRQAWAWARDRGLVAGELPKVSVKVRPKRPSYTPTSEELVRIIAGVRPGWRRLGVQLLVGTGARINEAATLTWSQVDLVGGTVRIHGKDDRWREVPIAGDLVELLAQERGAAGPDASLWPVTRLSFAEYIRREVREVCQRLQIQATTPHGLRRAYEDAIAEAGADIAVYAALLGHSPQVALEHYRRPRRSDKRAAVQRANLPISLAQEAGTAWHRKRPDPGASSGIGPEWYSQGERWSEGQSGHIVELCQRDGSPVAPDGLRPWHNDRAKLRQAAQLLGVDSLDLADALDEYFAAGEGAGEA